MNNRATKHLLAGTLALSLITVLWANLSSSCFKNDTGPCIEAGSTFPYVIPLGECEGQTLTVLVLPGSWGATITEVLPGDSGRQLIQAGGTCTLEIRWLCGNELHQTYIQLSGREINPTSEECSGI